MGIQRSLSHIHWPSLEDEKEERAEIGIHLYKKSCYVETFAPKRDVEQTNEYNT